MYFSGFSRHVASIPEMFDFYAKAIFPATKYVFNHLLKPRMTFIFLIKGQKITLQPFIQSFQCVLSGLSKETLGY